MSAIIFIFHGNNLTKSIYHFCFSFYHLVKLRCSVFQFKFTRRLTKDRVKAESEIATEVLLTPKLTFRLPSLPRILRKLMNRFNNLWKKVFKKFRKYHVITLFYFINLICW